MRTILAAISLILITQSVGAVTNEGLYKSCKAVADNNFETTPDNAMHSISCQTYIAAIGELVRQSCRIDDLELNINPFNLVDKKLDFNHSDINAIIQYYVNNMRDQPEAWKYYPAVEILFSIAAISDPCSN